jgi:hypothetical protein
MWANAQLKNDLLVQVQNALRKIVGLSARALKMRLWVKKPVHFCYTAVKKISDEILLAQL